MERGRYIRLAACVCVSAFILLGQSPIAFADEGGVSFYLPGSFGSLAATPGVPGWSWATIYYHSDVASGAGQQFPRGGRIDVGISGKGDLAFFGPSYVFATPVLGGQASISALAAGGWTQASAALSLTGPMGNTIAISRTQDLTSFGDVISQAALKWNFGTSNLMAYVQGDVPVGDYNPARLANLGIGHWAIDWGGGYTYFNTKTGNEFSWVAGLTYNFKNPSTQYQNGVDYHVDWGASHFFNQKFQLGLVGYYFQQITDDLGTPPALDGFRARIAAVGPQAGFLFPLGDMQGYINLKGYWEFAAQNRAAGWNTWLTFAISPKAPEPPPSATPVVRKY
jgi:hypothetical protein